MDLIGDEMVTGSYEGLKQGLSRRVSVKEQLQNKLKFHSNEVQRLLKALKILEENPAIGEFIDCVGGHI